MGKKSKSQANSNVIAQNKKARFDYEILETFEGGLVLAGSEVKSLREGHGNITESYAVFKDGEIFLLNAFIAPYSHGGYANHDERRTRKILLHKKEILKLKQEKEAKQMTIVPLKLYWKRGKVKVELALVKGKKKHDKRATIKERDWNRQQQRLLKR